MKCEDKISKNVSLTIALKTIQKEIAYLKYGKYVLKLH